MDEKLLIETMTINSKEHYKAAVNDKGLTRIEEHKAKFGNVDLLDDSKISTI